MNERRARRQEFFGTQRSRWSREDSRCGFFGGETLVVGLRAIEALFVSGPQPKHIAHRQIACGLQQQRRQ
jgi:hypothetical protein